MIKRNGSPSKKKKTIDIIFELLIIIGRILTLGMSAGESGFGVDGDFLKKKKKMNGEVYQS